MLVPHASVVVACPVQAPWHQPPNCSKILALLVLYFRSTMCNQSCPDFIVTSFGQCSCSSIVNAIVDNGLWVAHGLIGGPVCLQLSHLQAHFRCLGVDLRGNGGETPSGPGHNMLHFAEDISCVIQALRLTGWVPTAMHPGPLPVHIQCS